MVQSLNVMMMMNFTSVLLLESNNKSITYYIQGNAHVEWKWRISNKGHDQKLHKSVSLTDKKWNIDLKFMRNLVRCVLTNIILYVTAFSNIFCTCYSTVWN